MNASTRKCTDAKPCNLINCYSCRRRLIDETATAMLDSGADQDTVDRYRYPAINALAFEIKPAQPAKPKAPRKPVKPVTIDAAGIAARLRTLDSATVGRRELSEYKVAELKAIAKAAGIGGVSRYTRADLISHLAHNLINYRLDMQAILNARNA